MLRRAKILGSNDPLFSPSWDLYISAFPEIERRNLEYHLETLEFEEFCFEAILDNDKFVGIVGWWNFSEIRFIEHLATSPELRGQGYGERILSQFIEESPKPIVLEVEHPTTELSCRRIGFYQRSGFKLNHYDYNHPSYNVNSKERVSLMLMTHPSLLSATSYEEFKRVCFEKVHFRHSSTRA